MQPYSQTLTQHRPQPLPHPAADAPAPLGGSAPHFASAFASPFANPFYAPASRAAASHLYQQASVEQGVLGASPHQLVALLFAGLCESILKAQQAMAAGHTQAKGEAISRATRIVQEGLRAGLNMHAGGALAQQLDDLYGYLSLRLTQANLRNDEAALMQCLALIKPIEQAWASMDLSTP